MSDKKRSLFWFWSPALLVFLGQAHQAVLQSGPQILPKNHTTTSERKSLQFLLICCRRPLSGILFFTFLEIQLWNVCGFWMMNCIKQNRRGPAQQRRRDGSLQILIRDQFLCETVIFNQRKWLKHVRFRPTYSVNYSCSVSSLLTSWGFCWFWFWFPSCNLLLLMEVSWDDGGGGETASARALLLTKVTVCCKSGLFLQY